MAPGLRQAALEADLKALIAHFDHGGPTLMIPSEYLEVVIVKQ